jgi:hypothetical protein
MGKIDEAVLDMLLGLPAKGRPVSCPGRECPLADAPEAERRQHEADVAHWFPQPEPCEYVHDEAPPVRQIDFLVSLFRKGDGDRRTVTVTAINGLHAMDAAELRNPGWTADAAISAESA